MISALLHLGLAAGVLVTTAASSREQLVEVVLLEVKGDSKEISVTSFPAARSKIEKVRKITEPVSIPKADVPVVAKNEQGDVPDPESHVESDIESNFEAVGGSRFGSVNGLEVSAQKRYEAELRAILERRKEYPVLAKRLRQQGRVLVQFTLKRDGRVVRAEVIENSEFETLNKAAARLISGIDGFKPFPDEVKKAEWVFVLPVEYRM